MDLTWHFQNELNYENILCVYHVLVPVWYMVGSDCEQDKKRFHRPG